MPRRPSGKPWFHESSGYWCSTVGGKRAYLDKDPTAARRKLRALLAAQRRRELGAEDEWLDEPFAQLVDEFLDDIRARKKPATYEAYRYRLLRALRLVGLKTRVGELKKIHLARIEQKMTGRYSPTTVKDTIAAVQAVMAWAVRHDLVLENPLVGYQKPAARRRTRTVTDAEFNALLAKSDPAFRRVLLALRLTGCRPAEVRSLVWEWVDLSQSLWVFPDHKTITQQRQPTPRYVPLPPEIQRMCEELAKRSHRPTDHVFLHSRGEPYTKDALCRRMSQVRKKAGIQLKAGEQLVLYCNRHTFGTVAAGQVSDLELAGLLGHTDVRTTQKYVHLSAERIKRIRSRVVQQAPGSG